MVVGWMAFTFLAGAFVMGFVLDGILRNALDDQARELLASRYLTLRMAYGNHGLPAAEKLLSTPDFAAYYVHLTDPKGGVLLDQNPRHARWDEPLVAMPTLDQTRDVPDWRETRTAEGLDYDLLSHRLHDGSTLVMGVCENSQETFFRHIKNLGLQIIATFIVLGVVGAFLFARK